MIRHLQKGGCSVEAHDPYISAEEIAKLGWTAGSLESRPYDAVILLVPHKEYLDSAQKLLDATKKDGLIYDLKSMLDGASIKHAERVYCTL